jgi:DNA-binding CsgD family transcriptional regulator
MRVASGRLSSVGGVADTMPVSGSGMCRVRCKYPKFFLENPGEMQDSKAGNCGLFAKWSKLSFLLKKSAITRFSRGFSGEYFPIRICRVFFVGNAAFRDQDLLDAIQLGLARDHERRQNDTELRILSERFETLTSREREVMSYVVLGRLNKEIAGDLGISEITVKVHRAQVVRKMSAESLPELARMSDKLKLFAQKPRS